MLVVFSFKTIAAIRFALFNIVVTDDTLPLLIFKTFSAVRIAALHFKTMNIVGHVPTPSSVIDRLLLLIVFLCTLLMLIAQRLLPFFAIATKFVFLIILHIVLLLFIAIVLAVIAFKLFFLTVTVTVTITVTITVTVTVTVTLTLTSPLALISFLFLPLIDTGILLLSTHTGVVLLASFTHKGLCVLKMSGKPVCLHILFLITIPLVLSPPSCLFYACILLGVECRGRGHGQIWTRFLAWTKERD